MSNFSAENILPCIACCDKRIASVQDKLNSWKTYKIVLGLASDCFKEEESKYFDKIKNYENNIKLIQIEKLLYNSLANPNSKSELFKKILEKYDELMSISYDLSGNMVINGLHAEGDHLEYCSNSLSQREYIRKLCSYGERNFIV